jgi:hypothetical protein
MVLNRLLGKRHYPTKPVIVALEGLKSCWAGVYNGNIERI